MRRDILTDAPPGDGNTPLDPSEIDGLIPRHLATRAELNQWEAKNIEIALEWLTTRPLDVLARGALQELHRQMFGETWDWAGEFRRSEKNISPFSWPEVPRMVADLLANTGVQYDAIRQDPLEIDRLAARFHHELVRIHPFPNGNGRLARMATDLLLEQWKRPPFSWGALSENAPDETRRRYIDALRAADSGHFAPLYAFVRS